MKKAKVSAIPDWIVMVTAKAGDPTTGTLPVARCTRCEKVITLTLPMAIRSFTSALASFGRDHLKCPAPAGLDHAGRRPFGEKTADGKQPMEFLLAAEPIRAGDRHAREVVADALVEIEDMIRDAAAEGKNGVRVVVEAYGT